MMSNEVLIALITVAGTTITSTIASIFAYLKSDKVEKKSQENTKAIQNMQEGLSDKMNELTLAKESIAHAVGIMGQGNVELTKINVANISKIDEQINELWRYLFNRSMAEVISKNLINDNGEVKNEVKKWYHNIAPDLHQWYIKNKNLQDVELFRECRNSFGDRLVEEICKPYGLWNGSCVMIAILIAKQDDGPKNLSTI